MHDELAEKIRLASEQLAADLTLPSQTRAFLIHIIDALSEAHRRLAALENVKPAQELPR